jgi:hypothetical protein
MEAMETQRSPGKLGNEAAILEGEKQERPGRTAVRDKQDSKEDKDQTRYIREYNPKKLMHLRSPFSKDLRKMSAGVSCEALPPYVGFLRLSNSKEAEFMNVQFL